MTNSVILDLFGEVTYLVRLTYIYTLSGFLLTAFIFKSQFMQVHAHPVQMLWVWSSVLGSMYRKEETILVHVTHLLVGHFPNISATHMHTSRFPIWKEKDSLNAVPNLLIVYYTLVEWVQKRFSLCLHAIWLQTKYTCDFPVLISNFGSLFRQRLSQSYGGQIGKKYLASFAIKARKSIESKYLLCILTATLDPQEL